MAVNETLQSYDADTPANNTPAGTDNVGTDLDAHLRDIKKNAKFAGDLRVGSTNTAAVTMALTDYNSLMLVDPSAGARTLSVLTASAGITGFRVGVKNVSGANNVVLEGGGSDTIYGATAITLSATNQAVMLTCNGSTWYRTSAYDLPVPASASVAVFTSSGTWTKPANLLYAIIEVQGGGGGGGGTANPANDEAGAGSGGGAGGYARKLVLASDLGSTEAVTVGAGGAGGASSDGADGSASTFDLPGTNIVSNGGSGGKSRGSGVETVAVLQGASGGSATGGDINITGSGSGPAVCMGHNAFSTGSSQALAWGSAGGSGFFGGGGGSSASTETTARNGGDGASGGGGGGAVSGDTGGAATGGAGGAGLVVVTQYLSE